MPIHPQDLQNYIAMLGEQLLPEGFEAEYEVWLAMSHRRGQAGPIGDLMIPLCRQFGLAPPVSQKAAEQVLWRTVARNTAVLVTLNEVTKKGTFVGMGPYGEVEVIIEGQAWVQAVKPFQVALDTSLLLPPDLNLSPTEKKAMEPYAVTDLPTVVTEDALPSFDPQADIEDEEAPPKMADDSWYSLEPGAVLMVELDGDLPDATFVGLGPDDGLVSVEVNGEIMFVPEEKVTIA